MCNDTHKHCWVVCFPSLIIQVFNVSVVVKVVVHHQTTVDVSSAGTRLVSKLNNINNYQSSRKKKVEQIINSLKEEDIEIVEASQLNESGLVVWMCCWSADGLNELKSKFKSGDLFDLFRKLFNCMSFAQVEKVDISSLQLDTDDGELQWPTGIATLNLALMYTCRTDMAAKSCRVQVELNPVRF